MTPQIVSINDNNVVVQSNGFVIMTWNLKNLTCHSDKWYERLENIASTIYENDPDILVIQELNVSEHKISNFID